MPTWFCWYIRSPSAGERTSLWTQKPTSSCSRGQSAPVRGGEGRDLRDLPPVVAVREPFARVRPRLAEVAAPPHRRAVPFAGRGRVQVARVGVLDGVVDGPALAVRPAQLPAGAIGVA